MVATVKDGITKTINGGPLQLLILGDCWWQPEKKAKHMKNREEVPEQHHDMQILDVKRKTRASSA